MTVPGTRPASESSPINRVMRLASVGVGIGGTMFAAIAAPLAWAQAALLPAWFVVILTPVVLGMPIVLLALARWAPIRVLRLLTATFAATFLVTLGLWPAVMGDPALMGDDPPFLWLLVPVATAAAAVAWPVPIALAYGVATPATFGLVRLSPTGGAADASIATQDALYSLGFGLLLLGAAVVLRRGATALDAAGARTRETVAAAAAARARDAERTRLDAVIHDSVMSTLLTAGRNTEPALSAAVSHQAAATLRALDGLRAPSDPLRQVSGEQLAAQIGAAVLACAPSARMVVDDSWPGTTSIPAYVAEAITEAATEALHNSVRHANVPGRQVTHGVVLAQEDAALVVEVADDGAGFDPQDVQPHRLGLEVAVTGRMAALPGGAAGIWSRPGHGTRIRLRWVQS